VLSLFTLQVRGLGKARRQKKKTAKRQRKEGSGRKEGRQAGATAFWLVDDDVTCLAFETLRTTSSHHITPHHIRALLLHRF
jgi:hypothetical protein